jgi:alpha-tubulin suppressor-like RCC1 family protein
MAHDPHYRANTVDVTGMWVEDIPWMPKSVPLTIQDVHMSKLHSAIITSDPESNLYLCGHGQGGRLGTGDEQTRFKFVCVETGALAGKRIATVALGLNHTLAVSDEGEIFSWGNNAFGQLGYNLPKTASAEEEPISTTPRQIFGPLKREMVVGVATSRVHSVVHTGSSLFTFGKNEGQLGIVDSDARSLEIQGIPRKVAASLFASTITAVSAMDKATVCLLESHDVWVFANYGYAKVSFPLEVFTNHFLKQSFLLTTYDQKPNSIVKVTCGGDTVCALSSKGEIYTFAIDNNVDSQASASTTNPSKIRNAIAKPYRLWEPKKSNMAARDVGVDADGSIILSTEEGSVWKRTKRVKIKDATASGTSDYKPKDYKFSRVPGLTRVLAVRASAHGAYAAVRRDCDITKTQVDVEDTNLWKDVTGLMALKQPHFKHAVDDEMDLETRHRFWQGHRRPDQISLLKRAVLESKDIEADLEYLEERCFADSSANYDALITTTSSNVRVPIHRFILTGRSRVMRRGFRDLCETSTFTISETAVSEIDKDGRTVVQFQGLDILTIINLVIYLYTDNFIDFWHLTRNAPALAFRYRQIRTELMKVATKLELLRLEPAARQMVQPRPCLHMDLEMAFQDAAFFHDGDIVVQLEDDEIRMHSALACARCPFFEGLFMGRAGGRWLAGRREDEDINVDLPHVHSKTFNLVLRHIYTDCGEELFDEIVSVGLDDFLDNITEVLSVANELMLDRLSQICQKVIGRYVNVRNVCGLLNAISPSSVHEFKDAALEYLCLSLEAMLQGHYLNELDEDLLRELDIVVRENQVECMRHVKNGRAEAMLHERHPDLAPAIQRNRQARIDAVALRARHLGLETLVPGPYGEELSSSPTLQKARRKSSSMPKPETPVLKGKSSSRDMLFAMDDDADADVRSPTHSPSIRPMAGPKSLEPIASSPHEDVWFDSRGRIMPSPNLGALSTTPGTATTSQTATGKTPPSAGQPWKLTPLTSERTDMKDIMAQAASNRTSMLSQGLAGSQPISSASPAPLALLAPRVSQKERKRLQQAQQTPAAAPEVERGPEPTHAPKIPAWQSQSASKATLKEVLTSHTSPSAAKPAGSRTASTPQLTMRQTVANTKPHAPGPTVGPSSQGASQQRSVSESTSLVPGSPEHGRSWQAVQSSNSKPMPQSIRHQPPSEPVLGLSMSEIVTQQQLEKDVVKEAVARRDLQDIQAEQEFEEWWNRESARVQEAERQSAAAASKKPKRQRGRGGKSSRGKGKADQSNTS